MWRILKRSATVLKHPAAAFPLFFGVSFTGFGVADYNREMSDIDLTGFTSRRTRDLGEELESLHNMASNCDEDAYHLLAWHATQCEETWYLNQKVKRELAEMKNLPELGRESECAIQQHITQGNYQFIRVMCRRGMIRNGHIFKWASVVLADEKVFFIASVVLMMLVL